MAEHDTDVLVQLLVDSERVAQAVDKRPFFRRKAVRLFGVYGREDATFHFVFLAVDGAYAPAVINVFKQQPVGHAPFRMAFDYLCLHLELYHGYGFVHLRRQSTCFFIYVGASAVGLRHELFAGVVAVMLHGECGQRHEVDAVAFFYGGEVGVTERQADDVADARLIACACAHPQDVVVAPLDVPVMVAA